jgi:hypothetical protein
METALHALRDQIVMSIDGGATLGLVDEELIASAPVSEDERAALWLFAWSYAKRRQRRPLALEVTA